MQEVYRQNSALGDPASLDGQLEENAQQLDQLQKEVTKYQVLLRPDVCCHLKQLNLCYIFK